MTSQAPAKEQAARVVDVGDPLEPVLAGLWDQHLHTASAREDEARDETGDREHGGDGADRGEAQLLHRNSFH
jgi:hypothetical protein